MGESLTNAAGHADADGPIQVAVSANARFLMPLAVMLRSLDLAHASGEVAVTVLQTGLSADDRDRIERDAPGLHLTWLDAPLASLAGAQVPDVFTPASLGRLLLPELLPRAIDRVIYLDTDVVVADTLRPLWELDLDGAGTAAVRDAGTPFIAGPNALQMRALGLRPEDPYLNSGVLVISLEAWRSDDVRERALALVRETILPWPDQDALNVVLRDRWKELPRRWNLQTQDAQGTGLSWVLWRDEVELALSDVAVIHYSEYVKPWHAASSHPLRDRWYAVLDETSFRGWRPSHAKRPLHQRVGSRARSAWQVLVTGSASSPPSPV